MKSDNKNREIEVKYFARKAKLYALCGVILFRKWASRKKYIKIGTLSRFEGVLLFEPADFIGFSKDKLLRLMRIIDEVDNSGRI